MVHKFNTGMTLSNEYKLLLLCARTRMTEEIEEKIKSIIWQDVDWDYLFQISVKHRLTPLLYWQLNFICPDSVPLEIMERLKIHFNENARKNLLFMGELQRILDLFKSHDVKAIPYKGPVLAIQVYGNLAFREFGDLDIYIQKKDILKAKDLIISQGYSPQIQLNDTQDALHLKFQREYKFHSEKGVPLEIQWNFSGVCSSFPKDPYLLFNEHLKLVRSNNFYILNFSLEDLLLILSIHCTGHLWSNLAWICDISEIIHKNSEINWSRVLNNASKLGIKRLLFVTLFLANDLFGTKIPKGILDEMNSDKLSSEISIQIEKFLMESTYSPTIFDISISSIKLRENLIHGFKDSICFITSPSFEEWNIISLPMFLSSFYYLLKPIRLLKNYGWDLLKFKTKSNLFNSNK